MPDLIVIVGPPASGKAAIGHALAQQTGFRFLHNHMVAEPAAALFGWGTPSYTEAIADLILLLLEKSLAQADAPNVIFTFVWAFDLPSDNALMAKVVRLVEGKGLKACFVELLASQQARIDREGTPLRLRLKPAKHDVESERARHAWTDAQYRMNSAGDFPYPQRHLILDTERQAPAESAKLIAQRFGL